MLKRWRQVLFGGLGAVFFLLTAAPSALALDPGNYTLLTTPFYDPSVECTVDVPVSLSGDGNIQKAFNYFVSQGMPGVSAAGILGNLKMESGVVPTSEQTPGAWQDMSDDYNHAVGIAQWDGPRRPKFINYAESHGFTLQQLENGDPNLLAFELDYLWNDLKTGYPGTFAQMKSETDVTQATTDFLVGFEEGSYALTHPDQVYLPTRIEYAKAILSQYGSSSGSGGTSVTTTSNSGCDSTAPGQDTTYVNGFTVYSQYDPAWATKPYGDSTIAASGCGPSAAAMIITTLTGQPITPDITATYADQHGLYVSGSGSSWMIGPDLAKHWGLNSKPISASAAAITAALQSNALVIVAGQGPEPFTTAGHFIVIRAATTDGQWMVGDSAHPDANKKAWSPDLILAGIIADGSSGSVYAISK